MTVNTKKITSGPYVGNDIADTFSYTFKVDDKEQLSVYETNDLGIESLLVVDTNYTVNDIGNDGGGTITRAAGVLPTGYEWFVRSNYKETQLTSFSSQGAFFPEVHENAMDKLTFLIQQILDEKNRSPSVSNSYTGPLPLSLEDPEPGLAIRWNGDGDGLENYEPATVSNDEIASDKVVINYSTLNAAINDDKLKLNQECNIGERKGGTGGGAKWKVVLLSSVTPSVGAPDIGNIVACVGAPTLALVLRNTKYPGATKIEETINPRQWGAESSIVGVASGFDNSPVTQLIFNHVTSNGSGEIHWGNGRFYFASNVNQPIVDDGLGTNGVLMKGTGRKTTELFTDQNIDMFTHQDSFIAKDLSIAQRGTDGVTKFTGVGFRSNGQCRFCHFENLGVWWFKFGNLQRYSVWNSFKNISYNGNLCGVKLARHRDMEDQTNPSATNSWNLSSIVGTNTKTFTATTIQDTTKSWAVDMLIDHRVTNNTQSVSGTITSNTVDTFSVNWDSGSPSWNAADAYTIFDAGWFNNANIFDTIAFNGDKETSGGRGEVGFLGAVQGCVFNNITTQNYERSGAIANQVLPLGQVSTGFQIEGGGDYSTNAKGNIINGLYQERSFKSLKVADVDQLIINTWFTQGQTGAENLLEVDTSTMVVTGQVNQSGGWAADIVANDSNVTFNRPLQSSGGSSGRSLTNSYFSEDGVPINPTILTKQVSMSSLTGGAIVIDAAADTVGYVRHSMEVTVQGRLDVGSVTPTPSGDWFHIDDLPFNAANLDERAGNASVSITYFSGGVTTLVGGIILENTTTIRVYKDPSTVLAGDSMYIATTYLTDDYS